MEPENSEDIFKSKIISNVAKTIDCFNMLNEGDRVLISVSGGPDSTFLTYVLHYLKTKMDLTLFGFHLDHMTRNGESGKDALFVKDLCRKMNIELIKKKVDVKKWCRENKKTFQEGARILRAEMLAETSAQLGTDKIAVGHNADDNIETFLMRLIRGAGVRGLAGIKPVDGKFIRPLINTYREDMVEFLKKNKISYCIDKTNIENIYFRNKIRNMLVPFIRDNFLSAFKKNVLRSIEILRCENDFIKSYSESKLNKIATFYKSVDNESTACVKIPIKKLDTLEDAVKRRVLLRSIEKVKGDLENVKSRNVEDIIKILNIGGKSKNVCVHGKIKAAKEGKYIYVYSVEGIKKLPGRLKWLAECRDEENGSFIEEEQIEIGKKKRYKKFEAELLSKILNVSGKNLNFSCMDNIDNMEAYLDYDKIKFPVRVRRWEKGDKFYPLGMMKEKKLHDFFIDCKIPRRLRKMVPVFLDREKIIWVGKYRIDDRVKMSSSTCKVLYLKLFDNQIKVGVYGQ